MTCNLSYCLISANSAPRYTQYNSSTRLLDQVFSILSTEGIIQLQCRKDVEKPFVTAFGASSASSQSRKREFKTSELRSFGYHNNPEEDKLSEHKARTICDHAALSADERATNTEISELPITFHLQFERKLEKIN